MTQETFMTFFVPVVNNLHFALPALFVAFAAYCVVTFVMTFFD